MSKKNHKTAIWGVLVMILTILSLVDWNFMQAAEKQYSQPNEIVITSRMPFTPEFAFALGKNSQVNMEKNNFSLGEKIEVKVISMGAKDKTLKNQKLTLEMENKETGMKTLILDGQENDSREVVFGFIAQEKMLGTNQITVTNKTYKREVVLKDQPKFKVKDGQNENSDGQNWNKFLTKLFSWMKIG